MHIYGDSISNTSGASTPALAWSNKLAAFLGLPLTNHAVNGSAALDQAIVSRTASAPGLTEIITLMIGANDAQRYLTAAQREHYRKAVRDIVCWQNMPQRTSARSPSVTYTGTWQDAQPAWSTGRLAYATGATATTTFKGKSVYIGTILQELAQTNASSCDVFVDNVLVGTMSSNGAGIGTGLGNIFGPGAYRLTGYPDVQGQVHTFKWVLTAGYAYLEYVAGSDQPLGAPFYLSNVTPTFQVNDPATPALKAAFNAIIADLVAEFQADSRNIFPVDSFSVITESDLIADKIHPNDTGHNDLFVVRRDAMTGPPPLYTFDPANVYERRTSGVLDGTYWVGIGAVQKQIQTL